LIFIFERNNKREHKKASKVEFWRLFFIFLKEIIPSSNTKINTIILVISNVLFSLKLFIKSTIEAIIKNKYTIRVG